MQGTGKRGETYFSKSGRNLGGGGKGKGGGGGLQVTRNINFAKLQGKCWGEGRKRLSWGGGGRGGKGLAIRN